MQLNITVMDTYITQQERNYGEVLWENLREIILWNAGIQYSGFEGLLVGILESKNK